MRWLVEVSALGKSDQQKFCVEAESWQRALQAARAERGEEGPMSGFSIELLEEGYRAVDPLARVRFVVKRAPDDMPVSTLTKNAAAAAAGAKSVAPKAPSAPSSASDQPTQKHMPAASSSASAVTDRNPSPTNGAKTNASSAPRPGSSGTASPANANANARGSSKMPAAEKKGLTFGAPAAADDKPEAAEKPVVERATPPAVGSSLPGLPPVKLLNAREQDPSDASPLTYREYAFVVPEGTSEEVAADLLRAQLRLVEAHVAASKMGKLVNLAVFDVEFTGKPPRAPLATLTWKDWKGDPVIGFPGRGPASKQPKPPSPSNPPASMVPQAPQAIPQAAPVPVIVQPAPASTAPAAPASQVGAFPAVTAAQAQVQTNEPPHHRVPSVPPPAQQAPSAPPPAPAQVKAPSVPPPAPPVVTGPPPQPQQPVVGRKSAPGFPAAPPPTPIMTEADPNARRPPSQPPFAAAGQPGMVKTPSGRFVRGRVTGDELITSLFESMHDLHFLRDALDGGQFCLALATEVLPARAALIHFYDIDKREWVVACTRGKDTQRLLTMRAPDSDEILRDAARKRRAVVMPNASNAAADRYQQVGGSRSLIVAPIMQAGRALGAMEIINPLDGMPFTEDEGNAMTYIAEQYAEYLGSRGIVLDRDRITSAAAAH